MAWDANGNLVEKGGIRYHHDYRFALDGAPAPGDAVRLVLPAGALADAFLNTNGQPVAWEWTWSGAGGVIVDTRAPQVAEVRLRAGRVEIEWTEEVDPQSANTTVSIDGAQTGWELLPDRYTLRSILGVSPLAHTVAITPGITDLSGKNSLLPLTVAFPAGAADRLGYRRADPTEIPTSSAANLYGFHGHEVDPATGLVYMRNRWYDPAMGRFVTADPLGYVDGPGTYGFAGGDPANSSDPLGLYAEDGHYYTVLIVALELGFAEEEAMLLAFFAQLLDEDSEFDAIEQRKHTLPGSPLGELDEEFALRLQRYLHALTGTNSTAETNWTARAISQSPDLATTGILLHRLGDSFSHRTLGNQRVLYNPGNGHGRHGGKPDHVWRRPELYAAYVSKMSQTLAERYADRLGLRSTREIRARADKAARAAANLGHFAALAARAVGEGDAARHSIDLFRAAAERRLGRQLDWRPEDFGIDHWFSWRARSRVTVPDVTGPYTASQASYLNDPAPYSAANVYRAVSTAFDLLIPVPSGRTD